MNGDLSRNTYNPSKGYSSVRAQQGRASLDADINEQIDIQLADTRGGRRAMIGGSGGHIGEAGFEVRVVGNQPQIQPGRYWVDGIEVVQPAVANVASQATLPGVTLPTAPGLYLAYLDVWERPIGAVQDPDIREVALGGPDTGTRTQVVSQVRLMPVTTNDPQPDCMTAFPEWQRLVTGPQGTLEVRVATSGPISDPCVIPESAGFRGLENQLYRIQIHTGNFSPTAANAIAAGVVPDFKWSRDNGSLVAVWREHPAALELVVDRVGPGGAVGLQSNDWVELSSDSDDLLERGGIMARISSVQTDTLLLDDPNNTITPQLSPPPKSSASLHTQVRKWDGTGVRKTSAAANESDVTQDLWIRIEDGIEVRFSGGPFRPGSYWTFAARTATLPGTTDKQIEWPSVGNVPAAVPAQGPRHAYARLALLQLTGTTWTRVADCRQFFPQLTELTQLLARGGDGQHGRGNHWLPAPLSVAVVRGGFPVEGARVRFELVPSQLNVQRGSLSSVMPNAQGGAPNLAAAQIVTTDAQGLATVWWRPGSGQNVETPGDTFQRDDIQEVRATLLNVDDSTTTQATRFAARVLDNYVLVAAGGDGQIGWPGETLELALRARVTDGSRAVPGARVRFRVLNREFNGTPLNQFQGGWLHASVLPLSTTPWPSSNVAMEADVATDPSGVAQVQWRLGESTDLPVQRVDAMLVNEFGVPLTAQTTLFSAHHATAREINWVIPPILNPHLPNPSNHLQAALDGVATALARLGLPLFAIVPKLVHNNDSRLPLDPEHGILLSNFKAIELQAVFPVGPTFSAARLAAGFTVTWDAHVGGNALTLPYHMIGTSTQQGTTLRWTPTNDAKSAVDSNLTQQGQTSALIQLEFSPSAFGMFGSVQRWSFFLTKP